MPVVKTTRFKSEAQQVARHTVSQNRRSILKNDWTRYRQALYNTVSVDVQAVMETNMPHYAPMNHDYLDQVDLV